MHLHAGLVTVARSSVSALDHRRPLDVEQGDSNESESEA